MNESRTEWLREYMRDHLAKADVADIAENVSTLSRPPSSAANPGEADLRLVNQIAERIREADDYAAEREARAENLAKQAIEQLNIAQDRIRAAESGRLAAEAELEKLNERVREAEKTMEQSASRIAAIEAQLSAAERRGRTAEMRAIEAENALERIAEELRTRVLDFFGASSRVARAA